MFWKPPCFREGHVHKMEANCYEIERLDPRFPPSILELPSPPNKLYVRGDIELLNKPALSIIGARSASPYGLAIAEIAATIAAQSDICVVSAYFQVAFRSDAGAGRGDRLARSLGNTAEKICLSAQKSNHRCSRYRSVYNRSGSAFRHVQYGGNRN